MRRRRLTVGAVALLAALLAVPFAAVSLFTSRDAGAATINVPALAPGDGSFGVYTGFAVTGSITLTASGTWCTNAPGPGQACNGPNGNVDWGPKAPGFLIQDPEVLAFGLVGRIGLSGPWSVVGSGPTTLIGNGDLYLAQNDEVGQFGDNNGSLQVSFDRLSVPGSTPPVSPSISTGERATWTVPITNTSSAPLTGVAATLNATANGSIPLSFDESAMPFCGAGGGNSEICGLGSIPANSTKLFHVYANADGLNDGATIAGSISVSASGEVTKSGALGSVTVKSCGTACVVGVGAPGAPVSSSPGPPTDEKPTKQIVSFPNSPIGSPPVVITLKSVNVGPKLSNADKLLCPPANANPCSGQISVVGGNFSSYTDKARPVRLQIIAKWKNNVPPGRLLMAKPGQIPIQLPRCVLKAGAYNTPCQKPDKITGSAEQNNLKTTTTILFGVDPRFARRVVTGPDAPTAVKATAGKAKATVTWKKPVVTNGRLTAYTVTALIGKAAQKKVTVAGTVLKAAIPGLAKGKSYTFTVVAKTAAGVSLSSKASNAVKPT